MTGSSQPHGDGYVLDIKAVAYAPPDACAPQALRIMATSQLDLLPDRLSAPQFLQ